MKQYIIKAIHNKQVYYIDISCPMTRFFFIQDKTIFQDIGFTPVKDNATTIPGDEMAHGVVRKLYELFHGFEYHFSIVKL